MNTMLESIKQRPLVFFLFMVVLVIAGSTVYLLVASKSTIKPHSIPTPSIAPAAPQVRLVYTYEGNLPQFKQSVPLYSLTANYSIDETTATQYAASLGFDGKATALDDLSGTVYLFNQGNDSSLLIYPKPVRFDYSNTTQPSANRRTIEELTQSANTFLNDYLAKLQPAHLSLTKPYVEFMSAEDPNSMSRVNTLDKAQFVQLSYNLAVNNIAVLPKDRQQYPIQILLNIDGSVNKATITLIPDQIKSLGSSKLTEPKEALAAINAGGGIITGLTNLNEPYTVLTPGSLSSAQLNNLELVYLYDFDSLMLQPYYRFTGNATTTNNEELKVEVLITALPQQVFK